MSDSSVHGPIAERPIFVILVAGIGCFVLAFVAMGIAPWTTLTQEAPPEGNPYLDAEGNLNSIGRGKKIYTAEGCWHCHSQFVRPVANEEFRYGPVSSSMDSLYDKPNLFGTRRIGPDLSREAGRRTDDWHFAHLYNPRSVVPESIMPGYPYYFEKGEGGKAVPKQEAKDLVAYLQYLGRDYKEAVEKIAYPDKVVVTGAREVDKTMLKMGETLYIENCVGCHGAKGDGNGIAEPPLMPSPADLTMRYFTPAEVFSVLYSGVRGSAMPSYHEMSERKLWAMSHYVSQMGESAKAPALALADDAELVKQGMIAYRSNGCGSCHGNNADSPSDNYLPAPKEFTRRLYHPDYLKKVLREGRPGTVMGALPQISDDDARAIAAFLASKYDKGAE